MLRTSEKNQTRRTLAVIAIVALSFLLAYFGPLKSLFGVWYTDEDYSYGFLIPLITAYLIWEKKGQLKSVSVSSNWIGAPFFFFFLLVSLYGMLGSSPSAVRPAIPFMLLSIVLFCFGKSALKALWFPLFFLIFMIPLPLVVQTGIGFPLKVVSTKLGGSILDAFGISAFVQGNIIDLGTIQLQVVDACSGLRYILPLLALGALFAYFFEKTAWKRGALVIFTIPIAVITNGIRIGATGFLSQKYGSQMAEGFFHAFSGWLVFMFAFFLLFLLLLLLRLIKRPPERVMPVPGTGEESARVNGRGFSLVAPIICICALLAAAGIGQATSALPKLVIEEGFSGFPMTIGPWSGELLQIDPEIISASGAEEAFSADYKGAEGKVVSLYIGYRGSPFMENDNFFHSPNICLPSSGWNTLQMNPRTIDQAPGLGAIRTTEMVIEQMKTRELVYFWFQTKKDTSANVNVNRFQLTLHALKRDNTYDLFIRPITPILSRRNRKGCRGQDGRVCAPDDADPLPIPDRQDKAVVAGRFESL